MAAKAQVDVDVNSAEFLEFKAKFDQYYETLKSTPDAWAKISQSTSVTKTNFESMAAGMAVVGGTFASIQKAGTEFYHVTTSTARQWKELAVSTGSVAKNIVAATESLLKWTGILSIVTGGGGLFGFDRLAHSVATQRTESMAVGADYGKRNAFLAAFRRFGDPEGLLSTISQAQANQGRDLIRLGLSKADIGGDSTDVALKALQAGSRYAKGDALAALDIDPHLAMFSHAQRMMLRNMKPEDMADAAKSFRENSGILGLPPGVGEAYTKFVAKMELAGDKIEKIFVVGLANLAGPLSHLSDSTIKLVEKFTNKGGSLDTLIAKLSKGIEWLADKIDKPEFQKTVNGFIDDIGKLVGSLGGLVTGVAKFAEWLGIGTGKDTSSSVAQGFAGSGSTGPGYGTHGAGTTGAAVDREGTGATGATGGGGGGGGSISGSATPGWWTAARQQHAYERLTKEGGLSDAGARGLISRWVNVESSGGPNSSNAIGSGHYGIGQWSRSRAGNVWGNPDVDAQLDLTMKELGGSESAAGKRLREAKTFEEGAIGASSFERAEHYNKATGRDDWTDKTLKGMARIPVGQTKVVVSSTPGGNTVTSANAAAAGSP